MNMGKRVWRVYTGITLGLFMLGAAQGWLGVTDVFAETGVFDALQAIKFDEPVEIGNFSLPSVAGEDVKLSDFSGKVVFLNFWATWCPYCRQERPSLQTIHNDYKKQGFAVVSVSIDQTGIDVVKQYVEEHHITFPNLHDQTSQLASEFGVRGVPTTFFLNRNGEVLGGVIGPRPWDSREATEVIEHLLAQPGPETE